MKLAPATILRLVSEAMAAPQHRIEQGEQSHRDRHLPEHVGVVEGVVERAVAHECLSAEQHDLREEREREQDREQRAHLRCHIIDTCQWSGKEQRQHMLTPVGTQDVRRSDGDEHEERTRDPDVFAVRDELDAVEDLIAGDVRDADVDDGGHGDDGEQRERCDLLAP